MFTTIVCEVSEYICEMLPDFFKNALKFSTRRTRTLKKKSFQHIYETPQINDISVSIAMAALLLLISYF